ncbi:conserved hypothetical protein [Verticillium alfalfae VaMs.102]|uniref:Prion-inhibition and propagation HeLo domain-containing protein n=1 Tax=Verticillium alfalfae (strain VaMs.102 / ATCC MYA-4576 / FGSC 10136) TaxID=526221 RepID=C9SF33_VERA1|nr:conserved hypothetical protein [Verticillium alfalfae VaMs.102]EEY17819.1 conserved hypothetical protein [Verticillium alfalfae VaMs.102]
MAVDYDKVGFQLGAAGLGIGAFSGILDVMSACSKLYKMWRSLRELDGHLGLLRAKLVLQHALLQQWERDWLYAPAESSERSGFRRRQRWVRQHEVAVAETLHAVRRLLESLEPLRLTSLGAKWKEGGCGSLGVSQLAKASQVILAVEDLQDSQIDARDVSSIDHAEHLLVTRKQLNLELRRVQQFSHRPVTSTCPSRLHACRSEPRRGLGRIRSFGVSTAASRFSSSGNGMTPAGWVRRASSSTAAFSNHCPSAQLLHTDMKPDELLTLKCLGFFDDVERSAFGFVFRLPLASAAAPAPAPNGKPMVSLKALLDQPTPENLPTLEERHQASYGIALSISILHAVSWLHKSIRSQNVLFPVDRNGRPRWTTPYLVGFDFSRPDAVDESSEKPEQSARFNVYRHPSAHGSPNEGYRRSFDVYSLGVVLLEIGLWRPAWKLYKDGMAAEAFRDVLVDKSKTWLGHLMGTVYREAAVKCLTGSFDAYQAKMSDGRDDDLGLQTLYIEVVEVLGRLQED